MRAVVQRVARASVEVEGAVTGRIDAGFLALVGVEAGDTPERAQALADKIAGLRVFTDAEGKFNLDLADVGGAVLVVSQFTLIADLRKGRRPSFVRAARPEEAEPLVDAVAARLAERGVPVERGRFGAHMSVELVNDGPVTIVIDSAELETPRRQA